jgi:methionyl-tRNA formyltransferase
MASSLTLVFAGTPSFAVPTLEALVHRGFDVRLVVTQPDRQRGRGLELTPSPVKQSAADLGIPIAQPGTIKSNDSFRAQLTALQPDAIVVVGYGRIIPGWMIELPRLGNLNVHASLLPKYRGAAPIQWAIAQGETVTGITTMRIDAGLDTGDILLQRELAIEADDTAITIASKLAAVGADLMVETLNQLCAGTLHPRPQDHTLATLAPILKKEDGRVDFQRSAIENWNRLRGFQPWPGAFTTFRGKNLQILKARPIERALSPGLLKAESHLPVVGCGFGSSLELHELQLEGKKKMPGQDFVNGYRIGDSEYLGT